MKAIIELQKKAMDSSTDIVELVITAYAIAYKLGLQGFANWCSVELEGYPFHPNVNIPSYRFVRGTMVVERPGKSRYTFDLIKGKFQQSKMDKNLSYLIDGPRDERGWIPLGLNAAEIDTAIEEFNHNHNSNERREGLRVYFSVHCSEISKIICIIRKKVLDWALECEKKGILGEDWIFSVNEKVMAQNITYNIGSAQNIANHNTDTTINQTAQSMTIAKGDFKSLAEFLSSKGMNEPEIQELKEIIETEPYISEDGVKNSKIQQWLDKIAVGGGLIAKGVTIEMIVDGIKQYFGF